MSAFETRRTFSFSVPELGAVATDVMDHFRAQGYEVAGQQTVASGWFVSLSKGFKTILGRKTAYNVDIEPSLRGTEVEAGIGIFGERMVPTWVAYLLSWPVLHSQLWDLAQRTNLEQEVFARIEASLVAHGGKAVAPRGGQWESGEWAGFCTQCGAPRTAQAQFCAACGAGVST